MSQEAYAAAQSSYPQASGGKMPSCGVPRSGAFEGVSTELAQQA